MKASQIIPAIAQMQPSGYIPSGVDPTPDPPDPPAVTPIRTAKQFLYLPSHRPLSAGDCVFWFLKASGKNNLSVDFPSLYPGDPNKYLVLVGPVGGLTGTVTARNIRYKGVYAIGLHHNGLVGDKTFYTPAGFQVQGAFFLYITFEGGSWYSTVNPFMWLSNYLAESTVKSGDLLRWGTANLTASTPLTSKSRADLFFQKVLVPEGKGHYFCDARPAPGDPPLSANEENWPHADTIQADGSYNSMRVADCDMAWNGQSYFCNHDGDGWPPYRPSGDVKIKYVTHRPMPKDLTMYPGGPNEDPGYAVPVYLTWHPSVDVVNNLYNPGIYIPIEHEEVYLVKYDGRKTIAQHCSPAPSTVTATDLKWPTTSYSKGIPIIGTAKIGLPAIPHVTRDQTGDFYRTPDYPALRDFFGWAS